MKSSQILHIFGPILGVESPQTLGLAF